MCGLVPVFLIGAIVALPSLREPEKSDRWNVGWGIGFVAAYGAPSFCTMLICLGFLAGWFPVNFFWMCVAVGATLVLFALNVLVVGVGALKKRQSDPVSLDVELVILTECDYHLTSRPKE